MLVVVRKPEVLCIMYINIITYMTCLFWKSTNFLKIKMKNVKQQSKVKTVIYIPYPLTMVITNLWLSSN